MTFRFEGDARRRFDDQAIDAVALTGIFKENPCLFIVAEPSGDSYDRGYGGFVWVVGVAFKDLGYASIEDFLEYLRNAQSLQTVCAVACARSLSVMSRVCEACGVVISAATTGRRPR